MDRPRSILVIIATLGVIVFNWFAATGRINNVTPDVISAKYPTVITPAGYTFSIWSLIHLGLIAFSIYQALPNNLMKFRKIRTLYIFSCVLNCGWLFLWHHDMVLPAFGLIIVLLATLLFINIQLKETGSYAEYWAAAAPFALYFGWVTAAAIVNFAVLLYSLGYQMPGNPGIVFGSACLLIAAAIGVFIRVKLTNYLFPLAIAWALTGIAVKQSGKTLLVSAAAVGTVACLIATCSFVMNLNSSISPRTKVNE
jgi:translocator protein